VSSSSSSSNGSSTALPSHAPHHSGGTVAQEGLQAYQNSGLSIDAASADDMHQWGVTSEFLKKRYSGNWDANGFFLKNEFGRPVVTDQWASSSFPIKDGLTSRSNAADSWNTCLMRSFPTASSVGVVDEARGGASASTAGHDRLVMPLSGKFVV